jgi:hypothetical protein
MDKLMLDGNAAAGVLREVFAVDMTTAIGRCGGCGAREELGAAHLHRGAGMVLRCPHCDHVLLTITRDGRRVWLGFPGAVTVELLVQEA